jgi:D-glycero-D-manno-heptose 1,7-bisphosphate phosphatase
MSPSKKRAVFLDRDGVLIEDVDLLTDMAQARILPGVPQALAKLSAAGFDLVVVSNQTVVARGLASEADVAAVNREIARRVAALGGPLLETFYICPHHPRATLPQYRVECDCRKPRPGMLLAAARERGIDLRRSWMIGDRPTDIAAGLNAGTRAILVETGHHDAPLIVTLEPLDPALKPERACRDLPEAAEWILAQEPEQPAGP